MIDLLVVGGDSLIGGAVVQAAQSRGWRVAATTRRKETRVPDRPYLDLTSAEEYELPPARIALVAAARSGDACEKKPEESKRVNVTGTVALIDRLAAAGSRVVFLSTDKVFDGTVPHRSADDAPCPRSEYGRQKMAGERAVLAPDVQGTVVRLTKVIGPAGLPILAGWAKRLRADAPVDAFVDLTCAPITLDFVTEALAAILAGEGKGIYHLSGDRDVTWYGIACGLVRALGCPESLVRPVPAARSLGIGSVPAHTTLDNSRVAREFGLIPANVSAVVDAAIASTLSRLSNAENPT